MLTLRMTNLHIVYKLARDYRHIVYSQFLAMLLIVITTVSLSSNNVLAIPTVSISPNCGPSSPGFNIHVIASGFSPSSTVAYKFVDSQTRIPLYGYFETDVTGAFNDVTFADNLPDGQYKIYFGDDTNNDNVFDIGARRVYANVTIPCLTAGQTPLTSSTSAPQIQWLNVCESIEWGLVNTCETYVTPGGTLTQEGERAKNCISNGALMQECDNRFGVGELTNETFAACATFTLSYNKHIQQIFDENLQPISVIISNSSSSH